MSGVTSCKQCGCSEIDTDPARGDAVCTNCGIVLEESIIVSEITFEEDGHGGASAVGQFVSSESRGGGGLSGAGAGFHTGVAKESREITLRAGQKKIQEVAQLLRLNQHCVNVAYNFFKMALHKQLTKGRKHALTIAACVYMTCRIEETPHLLIDFSDVVQMDIYALGRAYSQISRALFIKIPAVDPCLYIIRFAHKFNLGNKTHDVSMTALRLVQRMKRDWIHLGRRPSGLCGAALLIAARLHNFSRTVNDVIKIVKVHETTLRKRLSEFSATPASRLTFDEFMSVDLEEEHDPPSFEAARIRDREQLKKLLEDEEGGQKFSELQENIEQELEKKQKMAAKGNLDEKTDTRIEKYKKSKEEEDTTKFIVESTVSFINDMMELDEAKDDTAPSEKQEKVVPGPSKPDITVTKVLLEKTMHDMDRLLMPPPSTPTTSHATTSAGEPESEIPLDGEDPVPIGQIVEEEDLSLGIDDAEIESYIMTPREVKVKAVLWEKINAEYLEQQQQRKKENKPTRKKKKEKKKTTGGEEEEFFQAKTANEAIRIMLTEKKLSSKINYDVLKTLSADHFDQSTTTSSSLALPAPAEPQQIKKETKPLVTVIESGSVVSMRNMKRSLNVKGEDSASIKPSKKSRASKNIKTETITSNEEHNTLTETKECKVEKEPKSKNAETITPATTTPVVETFDEIVIESGPVQPVQYPDDHYSEEEGEEISARQLLSQFRGGEADDDEYYSD